MACLYNRGNFSDGTHFLNRNEDERPRHEVIIPLYEEQNGNRTEIRTEVMG